MANQQEPQISANLAPQAFEASLLMQTYIGDDYEPNVVHVTPEMPEEEQVSLELPTRRRRRAAPWTPEEKALLMKLVDYYDKQPNKWALIAQELNLKFPARDHKRNQCQQKYTRCLNPILQSGNWTKEELELFNQCMLDPNCNQSPSKIAAKIGTRCDVQVAKKMKQYRIANEKAVSTVPEMFCK